MRIGVIGGGYIGSSVAKAAAKVGHEVWIYDQNEDRCQYYTQERGSIDVYAKGGYDCRAYVLQCLDICEIFLICVDTPPSGASNVDEAIRDLALFCPDGGLIVIESSVPVGFTREWQKCLDISHAGRFQLAHSPERLWPGHEEEWPIERIPKLVGGVTPEATKRAADFYRTFIVDVFKCSSPEVTEFAKLYENTQRTSLVAFANLGEYLAQRSKIDFQEVLAACATKPFGYSPFVPGRAGGTCLPANAEYLRKLCPHDTDEERFMAELQLWSGQMSAEEKSEDN